MQERPNKETVFRLSLSKLVSASEGAGTVTLQDALPELLQCLLHAAEQADAPLNDVENARNARNTPKSTTHSGAQQLAQVWACAAKHLTTAPLEEQGLEHSADVAWKSPDGLRSQMLCYAHAGVLDLCLGHLIPRLVAGGAEEDPESVATAVEGVRHVLEARSRLLQWMHSATRPRALAGAYLC